MSTASTVTVNGRPALRFERRLAHPREKVWRAVTEADQIGGWYPFRVSHMESHVGGGIAFDDGAGGTITATITDFDPPHLFAFDEHDPEDHDRPVDDHVRIEVHPDDDGGCLLTFTHVMADPTIADSVATGWGKCLDQLAVQLEPV